MNHTPGPSRLVNRGVRLYRIMQVCVFFFLLDIATMTVHEPWQAMVTGFGVRMSLQSPWMDTFLAWWCKTASVL
jgi:hypothetical protein